ncbi:hypothetical protein GCM10027037_07870 [Mucilaginibacter koreensis]
MIRAVIYYVVLLLLCSRICAAQQPIAINGDLLEHIFVNKEIKYLEDAGDKLNIQQISSSAYQNRFKSNKDFYPKNYNHHWAYWYRVKLKFPAKLPYNSSMFEFFDQTTDEVTAYLPEPNGGYRVEHAGENLLFDKRLFKHKNFEFLITNLSPGEHTYYFKIKSKNRVNVIIVYRTFKRFIYYTLSEYMIYGLFYGMIIIFCLHNLLMYLAVKRRQYLIYVLYIISIGLYEMSVDGIGFQYLWPQWPELNDYVYGIALYCVSLFALIFTQELLQVKARHLRLYRLINVVMLLRTLFFVYCLCFNRGMFMLKYLEFVPLALAFYTGITIYRNGFKPARFFVVGYSVLFTGFLIKGAYVLGIIRFLPAPAGHYSITISFVIEMIFLSFSIGDQIRILRRDSDEAKEEVIHQMKINGELKDTLNRELEQQVQDRTREVVEQAKDIHNKAAIIEQQNESLLQVNLILERQAEEICRMNVLLEKDNTQLKTRIASVTDARALSAELSFEEFCTNYPDPEACYKFLGELKWAKGYRCLRCENTKYCNGRAAYSRRCTKCAYEESVLLNTIFHNTRIPIIKAFYLVYLMFNSKGNISSHQLSEKLSLRQSTCWAYASRVKRAMEDQRKHRRKGTKTGWASLVLEPEMSVKE